MVKSILKIFILYLIELIEKYEYSHLKLDENNISKKIIESIDLNDLEIETDKGFKSITQIHKTQPYHIWKIELENGLSIECADNHIVFDSLFNETFIKDLKINQFIQTKNGLSKIIKIIKYPFKVSMFDVTVNSKDHRFYSNGILSHNTTTISAYFAWYLSFHSDRNLSILTNKDATTMEIISKVTDVFKGLPFFLKPGILSIDKHSMRLDNGCMLTSQATTKSAQIGFTIHVLYIDEFAHIQQNIAREFWRSVYPTLSSSLVSQCIISSTPYGQDNLFFEIWDKAVRGENSFIWKRVDYWEVPGHDDEWAKKMKRDFGEDEFAQEFELKFDIKTNSLLEGSLLKWLQRLSKIFKYEYKELNKTNLDSELYENLQWRKDFDPNKDIDIKTDRFIISLDMAEGKEIDEKKDNDYNVASINQVKLKSLAKLRKLRKDQHQIENLFRIEQIGLYRDNIKDENVLSKVTKSIVFDQFKPDVCKLVIEMNFNGKAVLNEISSHDNFYDGLIMHSYHTAPVPGEKPPKKKAGFKIRNDKEYYSKLGKRLITERTIIPTEEETYYEFNAFGKTKEGKYRGIARHDDTVMAELNLARLYEEQEYKDWLYDFLEEMPDSAEKRYALEIIKEPYDNTEINDDMFKALYEETNVSDQVNEIFNFNSTKQNKYKSNIFNH